MGDVKLCRDNIPFFSLFTLQSFNPECFHDCVSLLFQKYLTPLLTPG